MRSHEELVFLATAGGRGAEATLRELLRNGVDLQAVLRLAAAEGVTGSMARLLRGVGGVVFDEPTLAALKDLERAPEFRQRYIEQRLRDTLGRLDAAGCDVLVVGRAALGWSGYSSFVEMALEEAVIEVGEVREVREVLEHADYVAGAGDLYTDAKAPAMDVRLRVRPRSDLWERAEHVIGLPPRVRIPARVDRMAEACRQPAGWRAVRDVAVIVGTMPFNWDELPSDRSLYAVLRLARDYGDVLVPDDVLTRLRPSWWQRVFASGRAAR